jgi:hypothetical protein
VAFAGARSLARLADAPAGYLYPAGQRRDLAQSGRGRVGGKL